MIQEIPYAIGSRSREIGTWEQLEMCKWDSQLPASEYFCQKGILSIVKFINREFYQWGILSTRGFINREFYQQGILSKGNFINREFY